MRKRSIIWLVIIVVIFGAAVYFGMTGFQIGVYRVRPLYEQVNLGLDLTGGGYVVYQADREELSDDEFAGKLKTTIAVLRDRLDSKGYTEATVVQQGGDRIRIEIPNKEEDQQAVFEAIGKPSKLEFKDSDGKVWVTGDMVRSAQAVMLSDTREIVVQLEFNDEGGKLFGDMTAEAYANGTNIDIFVDDVMISSAGVRDGAIYGGRAIISGGSSGGFTAEEAENLAVGISSGALPLNLKELELRTISASLGEDALSSSLFAGMIGIIVLFVFMLVFYRLPGLMADIALAVYMFIILLLLAAIPAIQLTLPGIAGIILSVGMAVDANVIIFERFKEELATGKTLRAALNAGFHKAMSTIIDSNITTIIAAVVIAIFGVGTVKGFGYTLIMGIVVSMFTALVVTRALMKLAIALNIKNLKLYTNRKIAPEKSLKGGE
ncbi:MAG: protein translocase subunit SecD [Christensenellales bacterium]|jgi:preprotein translocase subunit SecD